MPEEGDIITVNNFEEIKFKFVGIKVTSIKQTLLSDGKISC